MSLTKVRSSIAQPSEEIFTVGMGIGK